MLTSFTPNRTIITNRTNIGDMCMDISHTPSTSCWIRGCGIISTNRDIRTCLTCLGLRPSSTTLVCRACNLSFALERETQALFHKEEICFFLPLALLLTHFQNSFLFPFSVMAGCIDKMIGYSISCHLSITISERGKV